MRDRKFTPIIVIIALLIAAIPRIDRVQSQSNSCEALLSRGLSELGTHCAGLGANSICYGFPEVTATLVDGEEAPDDFFAEPGYQTELDNIASVSTSLFSSDDEEWGIAMLNVQASTKSASANKSTVYLMLGDVQLTNSVAPTDNRGPKKNRLAPMQEIQLLTGDDSTECFGIPPSALIVQSPANTPVTIKINNVPIELNATIIVRAPAQDELQVITGNGEAKMFAGLPNEVEIPAGVSVEAGIGDEAVEWANWRVMSQNEWEGYEEIENVPGNIFPAGYNNPSIVQSSGVGQPQPQVQLPSGVTRPIPPTGRPFPLIAMHTGRPGRDLESPGWEGFSVGAATCPNWVLFHTNRDDNWELYALDLAGTNATNNITQSSRSADIEPTTSPDGEWIAFVSNRDPIGSWEIYISRKDGSDLQRLTYNTGIDVNPVWGPNNLIVFESNRDRNWELYMVDVAGDGVPVRLTDDPASDMGAFWYPDGENIVFESNRDGDWELYKLNVLTGELTQLTDNDTIDRQPIVSHDGTQVVWLQTDDEGVENLWMHDFETDTVTQLTDTGFSVGGHIFAPDDTFIAYHSRDEDGDSEIYVVEVETGLIKALTDNDVEDRAPTFWCETAQVIYQSIVDDQPGRHGQYELFIVNPLELDGPMNAPTRLTVQDDADDIFAVNDPRTEANTRPNLILDIPIP